MITKIAHRVTAATTFAGLLLAAGCSSSASKPAAQPTATVPPSTSSSPSSSASTPSAAPSTSATAAAAVSTGTAMVTGTSTMVLTAPDGHTLYYFTPDNAAGNPTCTGACATTWPPLLFPGTATPTAASGVGGTLTTSTGVNGAQVEYNGHPLYEFAKDTAPGQANGQGVLGKWYVAVPGLAAVSAGNSTPSAPPVTTTTGGGYGYGNG